jgi:hypothetical protein
MEILSPSGVPKPTSTGVPLDKLGVLLQNLKAKQGPTSTQSPLPSSAPPLPPPLKATQVAPPPSSSSQPEVMNPPIENAETIKSETVESTDTDIASDAHKIITELKIKVAKVNKSVLDIEMQNIMGELSDADFESKTERLLSVKERLIQQIKDLQ